MDRRDNRLDHHLGLPTVCALVYAEITGQVPNPDQPTDMQRRLEIVAHAISKVVPVHMTDPASGLPKAINPLELMQGRFSRGGHVFITKAGAELTALTVQRRDMVRATDTLKAANIPFDNPPKL